MEKKLADDLTYNSQSVSVGLIGCHSKYKQLKIDLEGHPLTFIKGGLDLGQECGPDDAAAPPHERDAAEVQVPAVRVPGLS